MCTTADDSMQLLDFDSLFGSAFTLTENNSIIEDVDQNLSLPESLEQVSVQNERNTETINYKAEYLKILRCLEDKNKDNDQIRRDYDQLKVQLRKVMQDYVELYYESKKHALEAIEANTNFEKITEELKISQNKMIAIENQYSVTNTMHQAALSNIKQLTKFVEKLENDVANSKNTNQSYKEAIKEDKRKYSTLKYKMKTYEEDLCSIAGKLDHAIDKKNRDRETQRLITRYSKKKIADLENIDSESVDTGRGSSFSNYSPAYSINFSPLNMTENFEQKVMKDASTSPLQTNETCNLSELSITSFDVGTKPFENKSVNVDTSKENIKTVDTASSPISFVDDIKITTVDTASSPISFVNDIKITTVDTASSPISFVDDMKKITTVDTASSPKLMDIAISPIYVANPSSPGLMSPSWESTASPIEFTQLKYADVTIPAIKITDITRPLEPTAVTSSVVQTPEMSRPFNPAALTSPLVQTPEITRPFKPAAVTSPLVQTPEFTRLFKPVAVTSPVAQTPEISTPFKHAAVTSPLVQTPEITRPFKPAAVTSPLVQTPEITRPFKPAAGPNLVVETPQIARPIKPADVKNPVAQTPEMTRPLQSADVVERSTDKTPEINRSLDPTDAPRPTVKVTNMTMQLKPTTVTKHADLLTGPNDANDVKRQSLTTKVSEMARPIETTDFVNREATTSEHVISLANNNISVISKTPDLTQLHNAANVRRSVIQYPSRPKHAVARRTLIKTPDKTKQNENINIFSSEKSLTKNFIETQPHIAQDNNKERDDDLEVRMILNKFKLDWNALSPMSITPDLDEEGLVQSKSDVRNDERERQSSEHSRSQIINKPDSLLVITPDYKKLTIPQNKSNTLKHKINEDNPSHLNKNKVPKLHSIPPFKHTLVYNENERQSNKTFHLRKRKAPVKIYEKNTKTNNKIEMPQSLSKLASNISSLESQSDLRHIRYSESNSLSQPSRNQSTQSQEPIKKEYLLKEKQIGGIVTKPPERRTPEEIKDTAQSKTKSVPQTQTKLKSSPIDNMSISKEPQSNTPKPPERRRSQRLKSTIPAAQSKTKSVPLTQTKLQSSPIDNISISKEPQSIIHISPERRRSERIKATVLSPQSKTKSVLQTQTKLQSSPIDNMSISKEPQSNTLVPPEIRRSERIKSTITTAQSKWNSVPRAQMKLQSSPIDNTSISKEPQSNTRSGYAPIISTPEYGRKRTICRSMDAQSDKKHCKHQKSPECDTSKLNSSSEICNEDKFTFPKPPIKRISRVKGSVSTNAESVPNNKDLSCTPLSKTAKLADNKKGFLIKPGQNTNENDNIKMSITHASTNTKNNHPEANFNSTTAAVPTWTTYKKNYPMAVEQSQNEHGRYCADYSDIDIFNNHNNNLKTHINKKKEYGYECGTHNQLDKMIVQYGSNRKNTNKSKAKYECQIAKEIEKAVAECVHVSANPNKYSETLHDAVAKLKKHSDITRITGGLYRYLNSSDRKQEFVPRNKNRNNRYKPTPTKYVESLMTIIDIIDKSGLKLWERALDTCRFMLFRLDTGATITFDTVESVTHLFVNMCQFNERRNSKSVLLFMLAAMYCANYKALIIINSCLGLVPEILPHERQKEKRLNSMNPLLQIFIFLLYFYKCKDEHGKVQNVRFTLTRRYGYDPTQENFDTILSKVKNTVLEINDNYLDNSMLEYSILLLAKRQGTMWCHKNIVQKIILPIIRGEIYASKAAFRFCLIIITKLVKPYNKEMIVHTEEVVNLLMDIIEQPHPQEMKEEIICGLMCLNMENVINRINRFFENWNPPSMSPKFGKALTKYFQKNNNNNKECQANMNRLHPHYITNNRNLSRKGIS